MKFGKLIVGMAIALGAFTIGGQQVQASTAVVEMKSVYYSSNKADVIYTDPELQHSTGRTLDSSINAWTVFHYAVNEQGNLISVDLGGGQWVGTSRLAPEGNLIVGKNNGFFKEYFSAYQPVTVYSDPKLTKAIGHLDPAITDWTITHVSTPDQSEGVYSFDLGNNQWVGVTGQATAINANYYFPSGTTLYNQAGTPITKLDNPSHYNYKVFETKLIDGTVSVKLGDDNQWAHFSDGSPY